MDAVPVAVVIESESRCTDEARARALLVDLLALARGPRRGAVEQGRWRLQMNVVPGEAGTMTGIAELSDDAGAVVATRSVTDRSSGSCVALASAVAAWAQIALDDELARIPTKPPAARPSERPRIRRSLSDAERAPTLDTAGLAVEEPELGDAKAVDVGATAFMRSGVPTPGGMVGVAPFVTIPLVDRWLLRPSVLYAQSRSPSDGTVSSPISALGGRVDFCGRIPGNYVRHRGIEFDLCAGGDFVHLWTSGATANRLSLGPAATLRGELGWDIGLEIRTMAGVTVNRDHLRSEQGAPAIVAAVELGASMRFR